MTYAIWLGFDKIEKVWSDWKMYLRQPCIIMQRCMGYYAWVNQFNIWKKAEFYSRKYFKLEKTPNMKFTEEFLK